MTEVVKHVGRHDQDPDMGFEPALHEILVRAIKGDITIYQQGAMTASWRRFRLPPEPISADYWKSHRIDAYVGFLAGSGYPYGGIAPKPQPFQTALNAGATSSDPLYPGLQVKPEEMLKVWPPDSPCRCFVCDESGLATLS
jgi:hypothetical protein